MTEKPFLLRIAENNKSIREIKKKNNLEKESSTAFLQGADVLRVEWVEDGELESFFMAQKKANNIAESISSISLTIIERHLAKSLRCTWKIQKFSPL